MFVELDEQQLNAIKRLKKGSVLCGGTGVGKSRTAMAYYYTKYGGYLDANAPTKLKNAPNLFIITTAAKRDKREWDDEMAPFLMSSKASENKQSIDICIDSWNNIQKYKDIKNSFFIFDEQRVTGYGPWVRSFIRIADRNEWILLTATPGDTWMDYMPLFIANGYYRNKADFTRQHVIYSRYTTYPKIDGYLRESTLRAYRDEILVIMESKNEAEKHHIDIWCNYDKVLYKKIMRERWSYSKNAPLVNAAELCYELQWCVNSDPQRLYEVLRIAYEKKKVIVFYNFDYELYALRGLIFGDDYKIAEWNGHKHDPVPDWSKWVYFVQYTAGAEGWNCTTCDTLIFFSQNYSNKKMVQAEGRIDRRNTKFKDLYYYHLKSQSSIDLAISKAIAKKKDFSAQKFGSFMYRNK